MDPSVLLWITIAMGAIVGIAFLAALFCLAVLSFQNPKVYGSARGAIGIVFIGLGWKLSTAAYLDLQHQPNIMTIVMGIMGLSLCITAIILIVSMIFIRR